MMKRIERNESFEYTIDLSGYFSIGNMANIPDKYAK